MRVAKWKWIWHMICDLAGPILVRVVNWYLFSFKVALRLQLGVPEISLPLQVPPYINTSNHKIVSVYPSVIKCDLENGFSVRLL